MIVDSNSLSSSLMFGTTLYRNQPKVSNKLIAQVGYVLITVVSVVEMIAALCFSVLSLIAYPFSDTPFDRSTTWLGSCTFTIGWSVVDFFLNPFVFRMVADEKSARTIFQNGNLMLLPQGAVL